MAFSAQDIQNQIPYYLSTADQEDLVRELKAFTSGKGMKYYLSDYEDEFKNEMLQGDGWTSFVLFLFETGARKSIKGIIISNSCDVDPDNKRDIPSRVTFAPLVKLSAFKALLDKNGVDSTRVDAKITSIKAQKNSNVFYLPANETLKEDYLIRFDHIHSMPMKRYLEASNRLKLFTLSNPGFYLFILKLSVHFCRLQENVNRSVKISPI